MSIPRLADGRHAPRVTADNRPFWDAAKLDTLSLPWCTRCESPFAPFGPVCPDCLSDDLEWRPASGYGTITSFVVFHHAYLDAFEQRRPYTVVLVQLDEGPRLLTDLADADVSPVHVGDHVEVCFEHVGEVGIPRFQRRAIA